MTSLETALEAVGGPWLLIAFAAVTPATSAAWAFWRWRSGQHDKLAGAAETREQRLAQEIDEQRAALSREQAALFDRLRAELDRARERLDGVERQRDEAERTMDRAWDIARGWKALCHVLRHTLKGTRSTIMLLRPEATQDELTWVDDQLPELEGIEAFNLSHPERRAAAANRKPT